MSTVIKHLYDGTISLADGTGTPVTATVPYSVGDFAASGFAQSQKNVATYETRGTLNSVRHTSRTYISGSFSVQIADWTDATAVTVADFVLKQNKYSANLSTLGAAASDVYTVDITLTTAGIDSEADETITLTDCHCTADISEGEPNTVSVSFTCYGTATWDDGTP